MVKNGDVYQAVDEELLTLLNNRGFETLVSGQMSNTTERVLSQCGAVILTGGESFGTETGRDSYEMKLLTWSERHNVPLFGICRGMQVIAQAHGFRTVKIDLHVGESHRLKTNPKSAFYCFHENGVVGEVAGFETEWAEDSQTIELMRHTSEPVSGVMFHPEREPEGSWARQTFIEELERCILMK